MTEHTRTDVFGALADPTRREILFLLRDGTLSAGEIAARFPQQRPAISKHLRVLRESGLLRERRAAQRRLYDLRNDGTAPLVDLLGRLNQDPAAVIPPEPTESRQPTSASHKDVEFDLEVD